MKKIFSFFLAALMLCTLMCSCVQNEAPDTPDESDVTEQNTPDKLEAVEKSVIPPVFGDEIEATDYSDMNNWLNIPETDYAVDVFYLYPTAWTRAEGEPYYCEIDNETLRSGASFVYTGQAAAFETVANVYAPFYRQVDAVWVLEDSLTEGERYFEGLPLTDAIAAFEYYLENFNNGKPFILAGHSQGSAVTKGLLKHYMSANPEVYERMVAAYVIGYYVTEEELAVYPHLKFAERADDTGVIISWNIEAPGITENPLTPYGTSPISINPITWTRTEETATADMGMGSAICDRVNQKIIEMGPIADATVNLERGTVICSTVDVDTYAPGTGLFPKGVYHLQDYGFYFYDIRANAQVRIDAYLNNW